MLLEIVLDAVIDSVKLLPFLFAAFCMIELLENYSGDFGERVLVKMKGAGPLVGAALGCVPQCGFSVLAANLFSGGLISAGTLLAVFLSTSDEAVLIMMGQPEQAGVIGKLIVAKVVIALIAGYAVDIFFGKAFSEKKEICDICKKDSCGCGQEHGIWMPAWRHTVRLFFYLLLFTLGLNIVLEVIGIEKVESFLLSGSAAQPFLTAVIGFIPNCAASVLLTELYIEGVISFASAAAGLCTSAGVGLLVLFRVNKNRMENLKLLAALYVAAVVSGMILGWL